MQRQQVRGLAAERRPVIDELDGELAIDEVQLQDSLDVGRTVRRAPRLMAPRRFLTVSRLLACESRGSSAHPRSRARHAGGGGRTSWRARANRGALVGAFR